jgi:hypothetical protein
MELKDQINSDKMLISLRNRIWKLLPIYEGKNKEGIIILTNSKAYNNYKKNLDKLIIEVWGASEIWFANHNFVQLLCLLQGMKTITEDDHDRLKTTVTHCTDLCEKMREVEFNAEL